MTALPLDGKEKFYGGAANCVTPWSVSRIGKRRRVGVKDALTHLLSVGLRCYVE
jgi:hypothetical protein